MSSKKKSEPAPAPPAPTPDPIAQSLAITNANIENTPRMAELSYNILSNPNYGLTPTTQQFENTRQTVFPQETAVRNQLAQNILQQLMSPTGITPEQQTGINSRRDLAQGNLVQALRTRQNLGGGLYGGRGALEESNAVADLQNQFAEADINRQQIAYQNSIQAALPFLQILFPDVNLTPPQFQSPVQDPNTYASSLVSQRGQDVQANASAQALAAQQQASQSALYGALFQGLGTAAGGALGGPFGAALGGSLARGRR